MDVVSAARDAFATLSALAAGAGLPAPVAAALDGGAGEVFVALVGVLAVVLVARVVLRVVWKLALVGALAAGVVTLATAAL